MVNEKIPSNKHTSKSLEFFSPRRCNFLKLEYIILRWNFTDLSFSFLKKNSLVQNVMFKNEELSSSIKIISYHKKQFKTILSPNIQAN